MKQGKIKKNGLVVAFGSGGARSLASLGIMSVLRENDIYPSAVSGSSMGAVIAAYYGVHGETETLRKWYESKSAKDYFSYMTMFGVSGAIVGTNKLKPLLESFVKNKSFSDTVVPVRIIATNLHNGHQAIFSEGPLIEPLLASIAIPGFMPAHKIDSIYYVDGGVANPTPIDVFPYAKYKHFLGIDFHLQELVIKKQPGIFDTMTRSFDVATHAAFLHHTVSHKRKSTIIEPNDSDEVLRFDHAKEHIHKGVIAGHALIRYWKEKGLLEKIQN